MSVVTERCYDCPGPSTPAIATKDGWMPITAEAVHDLALSGMLLAFSPEHVRTLQARASHGRHPADSAEQAA